MKLHENFTKVIVVAFGACFVAIPSIAAAQGSIQIVSALYGSPNATRPTNFGIRLQQSCGLSSSYCEAFCTEAFVGASHGVLHLPFGSKPTCRVTYRCGSETTQTTEADRNETIYLSCRSPR